MNELKYGIYLNGNPNMTQIALELSGCEAILVYEDKIIHREATLFGHQKESVYPFTKIQEIYFHDGSFFGAPYFRLTISGQGNVVLSSLYSNERLMKEAFEYIQKRITELSSPTVIVNTPTSTPSAIEQIKGLKELLDIGAITQEEFDAKKKQLLGL